MGLLNDEVNRIKSSIDQSYVEAEALLSDAQENIPQQDKTIHNLSYTIRKIPPDKSKACNATNDDDMAAGKTAYVNRKKVMGGATDFSTRYEIDTSSFVKNGLTYEVRYTNQGTKLLRNQIPCTVIVQDEDIANAIGLNASMIKKGETILGITGTYTKEPEIDIPYEEYNTEDWWTSGVRKDANALLLKPGGYNNFSIENHYFSSFYGYNEIERKAGNRVTVYKEFYTRVFNSIAANGYYQKYIVNNSSVEHDACQVKNINNSNVDCLKIYYGDLGLTISEYIYIYKIVVTDCPALMAKHPSAMTLDGSYMYIPHFTIQERNAYIEECETTFNNICKQIYTTYGIVFNNKMFYTKNTKYTEIQKKRIVKVIHDWLELNNEYGNEHGDNINQTMYPALMTTPLPSGHNKGPVCAAYAAAFQYCCWRWGISAITVVGGAGNERDGRHAWNVVCYKPYGPKDTEFYNPAIWQENDCTWDDIGINDGENDLGWIHFNVTTQEINNGIAMSSMYDNYRWKPRTRFPTYQNALSIDEAPGNRYCSLPACDVETYIDVPTGTCISNLYKRSNGIRYYTNLEEGATPYAGF